MNFIEPYINESNHCSKMLDCPGIIVMEEKKQTEKKCNEKRKYVNGDEQESQYSLQSIHEPSVYSIRPSC